jgi:hypothetical protein
LLVKIGGYYLCICHLPVALYLDPECVPKSESRNFEMGHARMNQKPINMRTGNANAAPRAKLCFVKMACGITSEKSTSRAVDTITDINPVFDYKD